VTVATNMAGRGTDIILGGNPEFMAAAALSQQGLSPVEDADAYEAAWPAALEKSQASVKAEHEEVIGLGGLYVLGTERHESRRIDNQLRGRSGRQGDPGESQFYLSLEDDLMRLFKSDMVDAFLRRFNVPDDVPIEAKMVTNAIRSAQSQVEAQNFEIRKDVLKYDDVLNRQRLVIYEERRRVIDGEDIQDQVREFITDTVTGYVRAATSEGYPESWDLDQLWTALKQLYPVGVTVEELEDRSGGTLAGLSSDFLVNELVEDAQIAYDNREESLGDEVTRELERRVILSVLDRKWREHLYEMDYLRDGIGLRAMAQRDPLIEYQREGFDLFTAMMDAIKEETVGYLFNVEVQVKPQVSEEAAEAMESLGDATQSEVAGALAAAVAAGSAPAPARQAEPEIVAPGLGPSRPQHMEYSAPDETGGVSHGAMEADDEGIVEVDPNASRAERRRAERANRKRRG
jgi:preprotein translocase subunit SecA